MKNENKNLKEPSEEDIKLCLEYSEDKPMLSKVLKNLKYYAEFIKTDKYFQDDKEARDIYKIYLEHKGRQINFSFGQSITESEKAQKPRLYDVLASIGLDFSTTDNGFKEFCDEFGYDEDSRKAEATYKLCIEQSIKLKQIFTEEEVLAMPR